MKSRGKCEAFFKDGVLHVKILKSFHDNFIEVVTDYTKNKNDNPVYDVDLSCRATIKSFENGGILRFDLLEKPLLSLSLEKSIASRTQMNTLRGIERFIAWTELGYKPKDDDLYWIHEEIVHRASKWENNPVTGIEEPIRTSDPRMDTKTMYAIIQYAMDLLSQQDVPYDVLQNIGDDMKKLWTSWYRWRYDLGETDPLFEKEKNVTWEEYCELHPTCELCGLPEKPGYDALERAHICSVGSRADLFESSWNWLRIHHSHHALMHADRSDNLVGWAAIITDFPFIKGKIDRAFKLANKGNTI